MENNLCKICGSETKKLFSKKVLEKYDVAYSQCQNCGFLQTEKTHWLKEAYSSAITSVDVGLVNRNIHYSNIVEKILYRYFDKNGRFLDFAGGYGMFTRIMRDKGFDFFRDDKYCENLFAKYFDISDLPEKDRKFELVTAFELMEHIENPFDELDRIFSMTDSFLFSTDLIPDQDIENWWYLGPEHGQHISFYTEKCLEIISKKYEKNYFHDGSLHLITEKEKIGNLNENMTMTDSEKMKSRTWSDFEMVRNRMKNYG
jgi:2-polyprenyl-3-methyl-5-hydroxy-6-metoxy-1,4-benzoquinol methylase